MTLLDVKALKKYFPLARGQLLHAVEDVSFAIKAGDGLGLVGESGSGKSTIGRLLTGLELADGGTISLDTSTDTAVQLVFQTAEEALNPAFTIERNIAVGLGKNRSSDPKRIAETARSVGLDPELLTRRPHQISGGQQARAGIARALVSEPELLVLDEPTAALDVSVQAAVLKLIDRLRRERSIALLFISHDLEVVRLMCDHVLVLYLGRVAEYGPVEQVMSAPAHPYTRALLSSAPGKSNRVRSAGEALSPIDPPGNACLFHNRCPSATETCRTSKPELITLRDGWQAACHHMERS
ncbi:putative D,D-dipeptide transport ATP-binding protein DdpF [Roseibium album]|nr:putative D,D-dipeptide transport ATP-binding protein DdpF [Roseibium album]